MGDIADDHIDGSCCSWCGCYFQDPHKKDHIYTHGYPVVCKDCWQEATKQERREAQQIGLSCALVDTI